MLSVLIDVFQYKVPAFTFWWISKKAYWELLFVQRFDIFVNHKHLCKTVKFYHLVEGVQSYIKHITKLVDSILSKFHIVSLQRHMEIDNSKGIVGHLAAYVYVIWTRFYSLENNKESSTFRSVSSHFCNFVLT